jgi:hypothetical protein
MEDRLMMTQSRTTENRNSVAKGLIWVFAVVAALFSSVAPAAPPVKPPSVAIQSGSGTLFAQGSEVDDVEFLYDQVRHVSLTIAYYSDEEGSLADLFAGPVWADGIRMKSVWDVNFSTLRAEDDFDYFFEAQTVEFDADHWMIELRSLSAPEKYVRYQYTVTYPKP